MPTVRVAEWSGVTDRMRGVVAWSRGVVGGSRGVVGGSRSGWLSPAPPGGRAVGGRGRARGVRGGSEVFLGAEGGVSFLSLGLEGWEPFLSGWKSGAAGFSCGGAGSGRV